MKSKIVVDSAANLYQMEGIDFACAPIKVVTEEQEYPDDGRLDAVQVADSAQLQGPRQHLLPQCGGLAGCLSGGRPSVCRSPSRVPCPAATTLLCWPHRIIRRRPEAKVYVLDSLSAGPELQLLAERLRALFDAGTPFEEICVQMEE